MLVDLGRNDLGRVCEYGSVAGRVVHGRRDLLARDPHRVRRRGHAARGRRRGRRAALACCPAGTLSGAPKVRAMEIIDELEPVKRGAYGGAVGWLSYDGDLDTCICIRTVVVKDGVAHVQAGGGTVADAEPAYEYEESRAKARGVVRAIELAAAPGGVAVRVLMVDNYDSFTYNLVQYLGELGAEPVAVRNDAADVDDLLGRGLRPRRRLARAVHAQRGRDVGRGHAPLPGGGGARRSASASATSRSCRRSAAASCATCRCTARRPTIEHDGTGPVRRAAEPADRRPLPLAGRRPRPAGLPRGHRARRRRRDGRPPPRAAGARRAVPPRVGAHARRQAPAGELPWATDPH